jgi:ribonuclease HI
VKKRPGGPKYVYIYTDGGASKWAFVVVKDGAIVHEASGAFGIPESTTNDDTESEGIFRAAQYAAGNPGNYILVTDSQAMIAKINGNAANATRNPNIAGIRNLLKEINESPAPVSFVLRWERRLSNEFMKRADALCK